MVFVENTCRETIFEYFYLGKMFQRTTYSEKFRQVIEIHFKTKDFLPHA
jgi:hypothetical protein